MLDLDMPLPEAALRHVAFWARWHLGGRIKFPFQAELSGKLILVGGLEHGFYEFPYIGKFIIPTNELHHFSEGLVETTNQHFYWD